MNDLKFVPAARPLPPTAQPVPPGTAQPQPRPLPPGARAPAPGAAAQAQQAAAKQPLPAQAGVVLMGLTDFDELADTLPRQFPSKPLRQRRQTGGRSSRAGSARAPVQRSGQDHDDDSPLQAAAGQTLKELRVKGRSELQSELDGRYDPLEQYALLHNTKRRLEEDDLPAREKAYVRGQINRMMSGLMYKHRDAIRDGLKATAELTGVLTKLGVAPNFQSDSMRELRFLYGTKGNSRTDSPLVASEMARKLVQKFGHESFEGALRGLRSTMAMDLRTSRTREMGPRLWLSLSDAAAFNAVQSTFAIVSDMRRHLVERARVLPKASPAALTVALLAVTEGGKGAKRFLEQIVDEKSCDAPMRARAYPVIADAVRKLPYTLWPADRLAARLDLLRDLHTSVIETHKELPLPPMPAEKQERRWREQWAARGTAAPAPAPAPAPAAA